MGEPDDLRTAHKLPSGVELAYTDDQAGNNIAVPIRKAITDELRARFGRLRIDHAELAADMCEAAMIRLIDADLHQYR